MQIQIFNLLLIILFIFSITFEAKSQGCSDAGVCSIMPSEDETKTPDFKVAYENTSGIGDEGVFINSSYVSGTVNISNYISFLAKIPFTITSGDLGSTTDFGDLNLLFSGAIYETEDLKINLAGGAKIATNKGDLRRQDSLPLPMVYQTSQGSNDLMALSSIQYDDWVVTIGYQHQLKRNENSFRDHFSPLVVAVIPEDYQDYENYESSADLKRGDDIMLKVEKYFKIDDEFTLKAGILPIYRLQESEVTVFDGSGNDKIIKLEGSDGLTFNIIGGASYKLSDIHKLKADFGFPVKTRDVRADGLTRAIVFTLGYEIGI